MYEPKNKKKTDSLTSGPAANPSVHQAGLWDRRSVRFEKTFCGGVKLRWARLGSTSLLARPGSRASAEDVCQKQSWEKAGGDPGGPKLSQLFIQTVKDKKISSFLIICPSAGFPNRVVFLQRVSTNYPGSILSSICLPVKNPACYPQRFVTLVTVEKYSYRFFFHILGFLKTFETFRDPLHTYMIQWNCTNTLLITEYTRC